MWSLLLLIVASLPLFPATDEGPTNLIVLVADGLGPAGQTLARMLTD